jgi:hypothetical protein
MGAIFFILGFGVLVYVAGTSISKFARDVRYEADYIRIKRERQQERDDDAKAKEDALPEID